MEIVVNPDLKVMSSGRALFTCQPDLAGSDSPLVEMSAHARAHTHTQTHTHIFNFMYALVCVDVGILFMMWPIFVLPSDTHQKVNTW